MKLHIEDAMGMGMIAGFINSDNPEQIKKQFCSFIDKMFETTPDPKENIKSLNRVGVIYDKQNDFFNFNGYAVSNDYNKCFLFYYDKVISSQIYWFNTNFDTGCFNQNKNIVGKSIVGFSTEISKQINRPNILVVDVNKPIDFNPTSFLPKENFLISNTYRKQFDESMVNVAKAYNFLYKTKISCAKLAEYEKFMENKLN